MAQHTDCGHNSLLLNLADDILVLIGTSLSKRDICNLSICCKSLSTLPAFDKIWFRQCEELAVLSSADLVEWRKEVLSYKALCRFLTTVKPLLGIWVHQNPELGNVVYVMPGFASVVGCRVIPQTVGLSGVLWAPVFEVISDDNGAPVFILHGRDKDRDCIYPGTMKSIEKTCNVLLLEVEPNSERFVDQISDMVPFSKLSFNDRETLLETVTGGVCAQVPDSTCASLFPCPRDDEDRFRKDLAQLSARRAVLLKMHQLSQSGVGDDVTKMLFSLINSGDFLRAGDTVGLTLKASTTELSFHEAWPEMDDTTFALYKLPIQVPIVGQEYAGLWGGTFGNPTENKAGKAPFFVVLSYVQDSLLIATKILEGTDYVLYPNGSAMFIVNVSRPSTEPFPWNSGADSLPAGVTQAFTGEGIADGYGFRCTALMPGSLFVLQDDTLVFVWKGSRSVFTLQRLDLDELTRNGGRVPALPPVSNFSYLNRFFANVFA
ncbi:hypothetical protein RND81_09G232100 [Saponaria officinalis]|uniref:F-box domain-containing protein n=1 Tax=Saponaria officinalis TaxID=3572 RepID=A0AAW1IQI8_SAPOF